MGEPFTGHTGSVTAVVVEDGRSSMRIFSAGWDGTLHIADFADHSTLQLDLSAPLRALALVGDTCVAAGSQGLLALQLTAT